MSPDTTYYLLVVRLLLSSGDTDAAHVATIPVRDLYKRWDRLIEQMSPTIKAPPSRAICRRLASWIRSGVVSKILSEFESRDPSEEPNQRAAAKNLLTANPIWWSLFETLLHIAMAVPRCYHDPSVSSALRDMIPSAVALRLVKLFQGLELFNSPYDPETPIEILNAVEVVRTKSIRIVHCLLYSQAPSIPAENRPTLNPEVHESVIRLVILSRHRILPRIRDNATGLFELKGIPDLLTTSSIMFCRAMDISGLTPNMLLEQSLELADMCSGHQKALEYNMISKMIVGGVLEETHNLAAAPHYRQRYPI
ncbi:hypothetical protein DL93DRAFT_2168445 [Clavulina sp. PMI_390]|nr:hypothetical protein DL93DRAFT_2168445 [Clavulina sp. PMI_390]